MLNQFPDLLVLGLLAPFFLRIVLGIFYLRFGYLKLIKDKEVEVRFFENIRLKPGIVFVWVFGLLEAVGGILLIAGLFTQIVSLILSVLILGVIIIKLRNKGAFPNDMKFYVLLFVTTFSLLFSGAGAFALDLPL